MTEVKSRDKAAPEIVKSKKRQLNLGLPHPVYDELTEIAEKEGVNIQDVIRQFLKVGIVAYEVTTNPDKQFIIAEEDKETEIHFIF